MRSRGWEESRYGKQRGRESPWSLFGTVDLESGYGASVVALYLFCFLRLVGRSETSRAVTLHPQVSAHLQRIHPTLLPTAYYIRGRLFFLNYGLTSRNIRYYRTIYEKHLDHKPTKERELTFTFGVALQRSLRVITSIIKTRKPAKDESRLLSSFYLSYFPHDKACLKSIPFS